MVKGKTLLTVVLLVSLVALSGAQLFSQEEKAKEAVEKFIKEKIKVDKVESDSIKKFFPDYSFFKIKAEIVAFPISISLAVNKDNKVFKFVGMVFATVKKDEDTKTIVDIAKEEGIILKKEDDVLEFAKICADILPTYGASKPEPEVEKKDDKEWTIYPNKNQKMIKYVLKLDNEGKFEDITYGGTGTPVRPGPGPRQPRQPRPPKEKEQKEK